MWLWLPAARLTRKAARSVTLDVHVQEGSYKDSIPRRCSIRYCTLYKIQPVMTKTTFSHFSCKCTTTHLHYFYWNCGRESFFKMLYFLGKFTPICLKNTLTFQATNGLYLFVASAFTNKGQHYRQASKLDYRGFRKLQVQYLCWEHLSKITEVGVHIHNVIISFYLGGNFDKRAALLDV